MSSVHLYGIEYVPRCAFTEGRKVKSRQRAQMSWSKTCILCNDFILASNFNIHFMSTFWSEHKMVNPKIIKFNWNTLATKNTCKQKQMRSKWHLTCNSEQRRGTKKRANNSCSWFYMQYFKYGARLISIHLHNRLLNLSVNVLYVRIVGIINARISTYTFILYVLGRASGPTT